MSRTRKMVLVVLLVVAIAVSGVSALLLNNSVSMAPFTMKLYRYKVKFECRWERQVIEPCDPVEPSQRIPVETLITTHINVYNPNHTEPVTVFKYFVQAPSEMNVTPPYLPGGHTRKDHTFYLLPNKAFEIDCDDVRSWPIDPSQPPLPPYPCELKGFVILETLDHPIEVVAVYNKKSADIVNKITFHIWPYSCGYVDTLKGRYKLYEEYELSVAIPFEPENMTLEDLVKRELGLLPPVPPEMDVEVDIKDVAMAFDFLECVMKNKIVFELRTTDRKWEAWLDELWPPPERPPGFVWPDWIWPCRTNEIIWTFPRLDELWGDLESTIKEDIAGSTLIDMGVPPEIADEIIRLLGIEIIDVDVAEGVGTSIDVEYIEPEIIEMPLPG